jgi:hypothetical protein
MYLTQITRLLGRLHKQVVKKASKDTKLHTNAKFNYVQKNVNRATFFELLPK